MTPTERQRDSAPCHMSMQCVYLSRAATIACINMVKFVQVMLKVIYHPLYNMNNFVTNKLKLPQDGFLIWGDWLSCDSLRGSHDSQSPPYNYGVIGYHVTLSVGHMIANHPI